MNTNQNICCITQNACYLYFEKCRDLVIYYYIGAHVLHREENNTAETTKEVKIQRNQLFFYLHIVRLPFVPVCLYAGSGIV